MRYDTLIDIGGRPISAENPTYFVADIAANHDGDPERAKALIHLAKEAGADCAKFQHFLAKDIVSDVGFEALGDRLGHQSGWKASVVEIYDQYHCRRDWTDMLVETCREAGIEFMTTPYDYDAIDAFAGIVAAYKVGSGDITWTGSIARMAKTGKALLLASGASDMAEVERAVETVLAHNRKLVLMQCNTNYTGDLENFRYVNLRVLATFAERWPGMVLGLSDHTPGHATVLGAVALGARVVEKHFTDDNGREGPDHGFAMNPRTWREMVERTRELEAALGDGVKRVEANEADTVVIQRRAIRFRRDMASGETLSAEDVEMLRPCPEDALPPWRLDEIVGRKLAREARRGECVAWADLD